MKKILSVAVLACSIFGFAAAANAGTTLTPEKSSFLPGPSQKVKVYYTTDFPLYDDAWIGVILEGVPHGPEKEGNDNNVAYQFVSDAKYDSASKKYVDLDVPDKAGSYTIRMYSSDDEEVGEELASVALYVGMDAPPAADTSATTTPGTTTPAASGTTGTDSTTPGTAGNPVTIINNTTTINQSTNTTTNNANTNTNISGSTIANSNIASNNQTSQTTTNDNSIKVTKYVSVMVNGQPLQSDVKPFVNGDGRTMLPVRAIAEAVGANVDWDPATQTATLTQGDKVVKVPVGRKTIIVGGSDVPMDTAAVIKDGRTLLPVRPVAEALGVKIDWDAATSTVNISKPTEN